MHLQFYKYQGTGNDFIIINNPGNAITLTAAQVHFLCHRRFGIGADGLMLLNTREGFDFEMVYYNADGNLSSMCGNGGRCLVKFAADMGLQKSTYHFTAVDGEHEAVLAGNDWVRLKMKDVIGFERPTPADFEVDTGSPHYVKPVSDLPNIDVFTEGRNIRYSAGYAEKGINVNFVQREGDNNIAVRTYERGVENETLSCGTGVTAAALMLAPGAPGRHQIQVKTPGGHLAVEFERTGNSSFEYIWLCGPATFVFRGDIDV